MARLAPGFPFPLEYLARSTCLYIRILHSRHVSIAPAVVTPGAVNVSSPQPSRAEPPRKRFLRSSVHTIVCKQIAPGVTPERPLQPCVPSVLRTGRITATNQACSAGCKSQGERLCPETRAVQFSTLGKPGLGPSHRAGSPLCVPSYMVLTSPSPITRFFFSIAELACIVLCAQG